MPYRIDLDNPPDHAAETLIDLGALDVEHVGARVAAIMPDAVAPAAVANALRVPDVPVSAAIGRDDDSVWLVSPRTSVAGIRLVDSAAFGTGLHPTTALCLDVIEDLLAVATPSRVLDIGTGSGILAIAALRRGVPEATGVDVDDDALRVAAENARLNGVADRLSLLLGGAEVVRGSWPLVVANVRSAELMEMAPALTRTIAGGGSLVLSGLPHSVAAEVERVYQRLGLRPVRRQDRDGWTALLLHASW